MKQYLLNDPVNDEEIRFKQKLQKMYDELLNTKKAHDHGILMKVKVMTMRDERVCEKCQQHDKVEFSADEAVIGLNAAPFHFGCRCLNGFEIVGIRKNK